MKKYTYLQEGIYNEKNPINKAIILKYDSDKKALSIIDLINKKEIASNVIGEINLNNDENILKLEEKISELSSLILSLQDSFLKKDEFDGNGVLIVNNGSIEKLNNPLPKSVLIYDEESLTWKEYKQC